MFPSLALMISFISTASGLHTYFSWATSCGEISFISPGQKENCCISLDRVVALDPGSDLDVVTIEVARYDPSVLIASVSEGERLFTSSDGGDTWKETTIQAIEDRTGPYSYGPHPANAKVTYRVFEPPDDVWAHHLERSNDGARTWARKARFIKGTSIVIDVGSLHYHPKDPDTIYAYAGLNEAIDAFTGFYVSRDGGQTFSFVLSTTNALLGISKSSPNVMYALGVGQVVIKSIDGGVTWRLGGQNDKIRQVPNAVSTITDIVVDPLDPDIVYLVSSKGIIRSTDGGRSWCILNLGSNVNTSVRYMAISPKDRNVLLVGTSRGLFRSKPNGREWEKILIHERLVK